MLPAVFADDDFAQRFVAGLDEVLAPLHNVLDCLDAYFTPVARARWTSPGWLGGWVGAETDGTEPEARLRAAVAAAAYLHRIRGTRRGLSEAVRLAFGVEPEITESGGADLGRPPARPGPRRSAARICTSPLRLPDPTPADHYRLDSLVAAARPAHMPYTVQVTAAEPRTAERTPETDDHPELRRMRHPRGTGPVVLRRLRSRTELVGPAAPADAAGSRGAAGAPERPEAPRSRVGDRRPGTAEPTAGRLRPACRRAGRPGRSGIRWSANPGPRRVAARAQPPRPAAEDDGAYSSAGQDAGVPAQTTATAPAGTDGIAEDACDTRRSPLDGRRTARPTGPAGSWSPVADPDPDPAADPAVAPVLPGRPAAPAPTGRPGPGRGTRRGRRHALPLVRAPGTAPTGTSAPGARCRWPEDERTGSAAAAGGAACSTPQPRDPVGRRPPPAAPRLRPRTQLGGGGGRPDPGDRAGRQHARGPSRRPATTSPSAPRSPRTPPARPAPSRATSPS